MRSTGVEVNVYKDEKIYDVLLLKNFEGLLVNMVILEYFRINLLEYKRTRYCVHAFRDICS
jgi:hypothetical protein